MKKLDDNDPVDAALIEEQQEKAEADRRFEARAKRGVVEYEPEDSI